MLTQIDDILLTMEYSEELYKWIGFLGVVAGLEEARRVEKMDPFEREVMMTSLGILEEKDADETIRSWDADIALGMFGIAPKPVALADWDMNNGQATGGDNLGTNTSSLDLAPVASVPPNSTPNSTTANTASPSLTTTMPPTTAAPANVAATVTATATASANATTANANAIATACHKFTYSLSFIRHVSYAERRTTRVLYRIRKERSKGSTIPL